MLQLSPSTENKTKIQKKKKQGKKKKKKKKNGPRNSGVLTNNGHAIRKNGCYGNAITKYQEERLDPDEMTHYEPTHQDLHRWKKIWSAELKGLNLYV